MKEVLRKIDWKNNLFWTAVMAVLTLIYYIVMDVAGCKHTMTKDEW